MCFKNHLIFSISFVIFYVKIFSFKVDYLYVIISSLLTCLLPDIDHPRSFIGYRIKPISFWLYMFFGRRSFTHSLLFSFFILYFLYSINLIYFNFSNDIIFGMFLGYLSHIVSDMFTIKGVKLLWPLKKNFRFPFYFFFKNKKFEYYFCIFFFILSLFLIN